MILVFFFLFLVIIIFILFFILILSTVQIKVVKLNLTNDLLPNVKNEKISFDYNVIFYLLFLNKIKYFKYTLNDEKIKKYNLTKMIKEMDIAKIKRDEEILKQDIKELKKLKINIKEFDLNLTIGTENVLITSLLIFILSTGLSVVLAKNIKQYKKDKFKYKITPLYKDENVFKIALNCIINVKMVHIIHVTYNVFKRRRVYKNERTSNRRAYDNSYEQHPRYGRCKYDYR